LGFITTNSELHNTISYTYPTHTHFDPMVNNNATFNSHFQKNVS